MSETCRLREIAGVLVRHGFGHVIQGTPIEVGGEAAASRLSTAARVRKVLVELGPTFVKLGQVLSVRPDIVPGPSSRSLRPFRIGERRPSMKTTSSERGCAPGAPSVHR